MIGWRHAAIAALCSALSTPAYGEREREVAARLCVGMAVDVGLSDGTRADCISDTHAIEVDWSEKWAEGIGQSLHYSSITNLRAGLILVCKANDMANCTTHGLRLTHIAAAYDLPITLWFCQISDQLSTCALEEHGPGHRVPAAG